MDTPKKVFEKFFRCSLPNADVKVIPEKYIAATCCFSFKSRMLSISTERVATEGECLLSIQMYSCTQRLSLVSANYMSTGMKRMLSALSLARQSLMKMGRYWSLAACAKYAREEKCMKQRLLIQ